MAYLYQEIMKVPGLTGTWAQRQEQLYKKLTGKKDYSGSLQQNLYLLDQIGKKNYGQAAAPAPAPQTPPKSEAETYIDPNLGPKDFSKVLAWDDFFNEDLVQGGVKQQLENFFMPQIDKGIESNTQNFADRGLLRSGIRGKAEDEMLQNIAAQQTDYAKQLYTGRENELRQQYADLQKQYEDDPTKYVAPTTQGGGTGQYETAPVAPTSVAPVETTGYKYGLGRQEGSPYKYRESYKKWYESRYPTAGQYKF